MSDQLSEKGRELLAICDSSAKAVNLSIREMVGDPSSGITVNMGADGTPTKSIDRVAEAAVLEELRRSGEGFKVLSEEIGEVQVGRQPDYCLRLDPLDGTFNAIKGIPFYSISIFIKGKGISLGYVCDLSSGAKYYAEKGMGAYSNPCGPLRISGTSDIKDFSVSAYTLRPNTSRIVQLGDRVRRIRTLGSTSLELCYLAAGKYDAFIDIRGMLRVVDVSAGLLIVEEAGGVVTDGFGKELQLNGDMWLRTDLIASNGLHHQKLLGLVRGDGH
jgi:myo-inositol-1(or 4)-monophosphatase